MARYRYEFATGTEEIEISGEWADVLLELDKSEEANCKKETRRHISLDAIDFEGEEFAAAADAEAILLEKETEKEVTEMLSSLTETQKRRAEMRLEGMTYREIARLEGVNVKAIEKSILAGRKKFSLFLRQEGR